MCVHGVCVCSLLTAVCVHLDGLNAEHKFQVWDTILDHTSRPFLSVPFHYRVSLGLQEETDQMTLKPKSICNRVVKSIKVGFSLFMFNPLVLFGHFRPKKKNFFEILKIATSSEWYETRLLLWELLCDHEKKQTKKKQS